MSYLDEWWSDALKEAQIETLRIAVIQKSIKHPHFKYAVYDSESGVIEYKWKPWYKWFSGKRIVHVKNTKRRNK